LLKTEKSESENLIEPTEGKRLRTTLSLLKTHVDGLSEIADARNPAMTKTAIMDEALSLALSKFNDTTFIDQMLMQTNDFWFNRDLERVKQIISIEKAKTLTPYQKAYLHFKLKDPADRQRVFEVLGLVTELDQINTMNDILEKASKFKYGKLLGYNFNKIAHDIRAKLTPLQVKYLTLKLGSETIEKLKIYTLNKFPKSDIFSKEETMNPDIETVLATIQIGQKTWDALPESFQKQIHDAVGKGQTELARKLLGQALKS
jgi:hypothetical protein